jgi:hypothetical protein
MPSSVRQRLLHDPVGGLVDAGRQLPPRAHDLELDRQARGPVLREQVLEAGEPGHRRARRAFVYAAQDAERGAHLAQQLAARPLDRGERRPRLLGVIVHQVQRNAGLHVDQADVMAERVVQVASDAQPLIAAAPALGLLLRQPRLREPLPAGAPPFADRDDDRQR